MNVLVVAGHTLNPNKGCGAIGYINESTENRILGKLIVEYINKTNHKAVYGEVNKSDTYLADQVALANKGKYDLVIQVHFNANKTTLSAMGTETLYKSNKGKEYAQKVTNKLGTLYKRRGAKLRTDLYWLNKTNAPAILIETCFVDSKADTDKYISNKNYTAKLIAEAVTGQAIVDNTNTQTPTNKLYKVCVGAYKDRENADKILNEAKNKGFKDAYLLYE